MALRFVDVTLSTKDFKQLVQLRAKYESCLVEPIFPPDETLALFANLVYEDKLSTIFGTIFSAVQETTELDKYVTEIHDSFRASNKNLLDESHLLGYKNKLRESLSALGEEWKLLTTASGQGAYFGAAFWNETRQQLVFSHRGTDISLFKPVDSIQILKTDIEGIKKNQHVSQINSACSFVALVLQALSTIPGFNSHRVQMSMTGHSLGAWLAQICTFSTEYLAVNLTTKRFEMKAEEDSGYHVHTVAFDSPGCHPMLTKLWHSYEMDRYGYVNNNVFADLDISLFFTRPNLVNTLCKHVGKLYQIDNIIVLKTMEKYNSMTCTSHYHKMNNIVMALINHNNTVIIRIIHNWPLVNPPEKTQKNELGRIGSVVSKIASASKFLPELIYDFVNMSNKQLVEFWKLAMNDQNHSPSAPLLDDNGIQLYRVEDIKICTCYLNVFSESERWFLTCFQKVIERNEKDRVAIKDEIKKALPQFQLDQFDSLFANFAYDEHLQNKYKILKCEDQTFEMIRIINFTKQLFLCLENPRTFVTTLLKVTKANVLIVKNWSRDYCQSINAELLEFKATDKYQNFVDSPKQKLLVLNTPFRFEIHRIYHTLFNEESVIILHFGEFVQLTKKFNLKEAFENIVYLILECGREELKAEQVETLKTFLQNVRTLKIIAVTRYEKLKHLLAITNSLSNTDDYEVVPINHFVDDCNYNLSLSDLTEESRTKLIEKVKEKYIVLQGRKTQFFQHINMDNFKTINSNLLFELMKENKVLEIGKEPLKLCQSEAAYSKRYTKLNPENLVRPLLDDGETEIFVVTSANAAHCNLDKFLELLEISCRDERNRVRARASTFQVDSAEDLDCGECDKINILIANKNDKENTFKKIGNYHFRKKIYWLEIVETDIQLMQIYDHDFYISRKLTKLDNSQENIDNPQKYIDNPQEYIGEETFAKQNRKVVIIVDEPGMGKSTTLTRLSEYVLKDNWVIRLNLLECQNEILNLLPDDDNDQLLLTIDSVVEFLLAASGENVNNNNSLFTANLLKRCLNNDQLTNQVLILFDGCDEIDEMCREKLVLLMRYIKDKTCAKQWITSRVKCKDELEENLDVSAVNFQELSKDERVKFLLNFWQVRLKLELSEDKRVVSEKWRIFSAALLDKADQVLNENESSFMGIPLQMRLLAESFLPNFKSFVVDEEAEVPSFGALNVAHIYQRFIKIKYEIYFREKTLLSVGLNPVSEKWVCNELTKLFQKLAVELIFPPDKRHWLRLSSPFLNNEKFRIERNEMLELERVGLGIVQFDAFNREKLEFIHRTFAEYFAAQLILNWLTKPVHPQMFRANKVALSAVHKEQPVICEFLNRLIPASEKDGRKLIKAANFQADILDDLRYVSFKKYPEWIRFILSFFRNKTWLLKENEFLHYFQYALTRDESGESVKYLLQLTICHSDVIRKIVEKTLVGKEAFVFNLPSVNEASSNRDLNFTVVKNNVALCLQALQFSKIFKAIKTNNCDLNKDSEISQLIGQFGEETSSNTLIKLIGKRHKAYFENIYIQDLYHEFKTFMLKTYFKNDRENEDFTLFESVLEDFKPDSAEIYGKFIRNILDYSDFDTIFRSDFDSDLDRDWYRKFHRSFHRDFDRDFDRDWNRDFDRKFRRDFPSDFDRDFPSDFDIDFHRILESSFHRDFDRDSNGNLDRDWNRHSHSDFDLDLNSHFDWVFNRDFIGDCNRNCYIDYKRLFTKSCDKIYAKHFRNNLSCEETSLEKRNNFVQLIRTMFEVYFKCWNYLAAGGLFKRFMHNLNKHMKSKDIKHFEKIFKYLQKHFYLDFDADRKKYYIGRGLEAAGALDTEEYKKFISQLFYKDKKFNLLLGKYISPSYKISNVKSEKMVDNAVAGISKSDLQSIIKTELKSCANVSDWFTIYDRHFKPLLKSELDINDETILSQQTFNQFKNVPIISAHMLSIFSFYNWKYVQPWFHSIKCPETKHLLSHYSDTLKNINFDLSKLKLIGQIMFEKIKAINSRGIKNFQQLLECTTQPFIAQWLEDEFKANEQLRNYEIDKYVLEKVLTLVATHGSLALRKAFNIKDISTFKQIARCLLEHFPILFHLLALKLNYHKNSFPDIEKFHILLKLTRTKFPKSAPTLAMIVDKDLKNVFHATFKNSKNAQLLSLLIKIFKPYPTILKHLLLTPDRNGKNFLNYALTECWDHPLQLLLTQFNEHFEIFQYIMKNFVQNEDEKLSLYEASVRNHPTHLLTFLNHLLSIQNVFSNYYIIPRKQNLEKPAFYLAGERGCIEVIHGFIKALKADEKLMWQLLTWVDPCSGKSVVHRAAEIGYGEVVEALLLTCSNDRLQQLILMKNLSGHTPLDCAILSQKSVISDDFTICSRKKLVAKVSFKSLQTKFRDLDFTAEELLCWKELISGLKSLPTVVKLLLIYAKCFNSANLKSAILENKDLELALECVQTTLENDGCYYPHKGAFDEGFDLFPHVMDNPECNEEEKLSLYEAAVRSNPGHLVTFLNHLLSLRNIFNDFILPVRNNQKPAFYLAGKRGCKDVLDVLIQALKNNKDLLWQLMTWVDPESQKTVVHQAAEKGYGEIVEALLMTCSKDQLQQLILMKDKLGHTPLDCAVLSEKQTILNDFEINARLEFIASESFQSLLNNVGNFNYVEAKQLLSCPELCSRLKNLPMVVKLVLVYAKCLNNVELMLAIFENEELKLALESVYIYADDYGYCLYECAILREDEEVLKLLMNKGVDINSTNGLGYTALMMAMDKLGADSMEFLIMDRENKADFYAEDVYGNSVFSLAYPKPTSNNIRNNTFN